MNKKIMFFSLCLLLLGPVCRGNTARVSTAGLRIPFISNRGQVDNHVRFYAHTFGGVVYLTRSGEIVYSFAGPDIEPPESSNEKFSPSNREMLSLKETFVGGNVAYIHGRERLSAGIHHFQGADRKNWMNDLPAFESIDMGEVYPGIRIMLKATGGSVEKLFILEQEANPGDIKLTIQGIQEISIQESGEMELKTELGSVRFTKPVAYQEVGNRKHSIPVDYAVHGNAYGFTLGPYDPSIPLVIDPLIASTFLGGKRTDDAYEPSVALDKQGNVYVCGFTGSFDFPITQGVYRSSSHRGARDCFISKFSSDLSTLEASTFIGGRGSVGGFIGGNGDELGHGLAVDSEGNVYLAGYTESPDFPVTPGSYDEIYNGGRDAFVSKLDSSLSTLLASTFLGGSGNEGYRWPRISMALDKEGDVIVTGITHSIDFPTSESAYDRIFNGGLESGDAFVARFDKNLTKLKASTYIGGKGNEWRVTVRLDQENNIFVCGETESPDFPTTSKAFRKEAMSNAEDVVKDVFISRFSPDLTTLTASTLFGGSDLDEALCMRINKAGDIFIGGYTHSTDLPTTHDSHQQKWAGGVRDAYISRFNSDLSLLTASTFLGGSQFEMCRGLVLDKEGDVYVTGVTASADFPVTTGAFNLNFRTGSRNQRDAFVAKLTPDLKRLSISGCFGGKSVDDAYCIEIDRMGDVYIAGITWSKDFPTSPGAFDNTYNGGPGDCFVIKFDGKLSGKVPIQ